MAVAAVELVSSGFFPARGAAPENSRPALDSSESQTKKSSAAISETPPIAAALRVSQKDAQTLAAQVLAIFKAKCVECHDEATAHPRGDFGYVLDLPRVAANRDWVSPGNADDSELYQLVEDDEMPGDEATVPPLTPEEKEIVRRWIAAGAPTDFSFSQKENANAASASAANESADDANAETNPREEKTAVVAANDAAISASKNAPSRARTLTFGWRLIRAIGQFHPPSSHFPIALLIAAIPAEVMWKLTRKHSWKAIVRFCVTLGAASAVVTAALGWCDAAFSNYTGASAPVLAWHRWIGTATAIWAVLTALLSEFAHRENYPRKLRYAFRACLLAGVILVSVSGFLGASLIYGLRHFRW